MTYGEISVTTPDFKTLFESAPGLYLVLTPDLTIVAVSNAYLQATMTKREEILGRGMFDVFPDNPDDPTALRNLRTSVESVLQNRVAHTMAVQKYDIRRPESLGGGFEQRYWTPVNSPVFGVDNEVAYIIHQVEDVTESVQLKQQEQYAERAFLEAVLQQMPAGVIIAEAPSGRLILSNERLVEILRHPFLPVAGINDYDKYKGYHGDGQPYKPEEWPLARAIVLGEFVTGEEIDYLCGDGTYRTLYANAAPIRDRSGQIIAGVLTFYDITSRKLALEAQKQHNANLERQVQERTAQLQQALEFEAMLKRITDKVRDSLDESQILQTALEELALVLGVNCCNTALYNLEEGTSTIYYEYATLNPGAQARVMQLDNFPEVYQQILSGQYCQFCSIFPNPIRGRVTLLACPILDDQGVMGDLWLITQHEYAFNDLEIRLVQQVANQCAIALRQARLYQAAKAQVEELQKLSRLKDDFLSTVSHELRTPMANIKMAIQMLKISTTDERSQRYLDILQNECSREIQLINDLLDLQRLETASYPSLLVEAINLQDWLPTIIESFHVHTQQRQQNLQLNIPPDLPTLVSDRANLERIIAELLNNACKYTPSGGEINLSIDYDSVCAATVFTISNSVEIAAVELPRIFDKFYRVCDSDRWKQGGTGLGLALVQKLVEQLQGTILVESSTGWTTFTVQIPNAILSH